MVSQLNALALGVMCVGLLVSTLQSLWQHPVIHCVLSNNFFGASVIFTDNVTVSAAALLCCGKSQLGPGAELTLPTPCASSRLNCSSVLFCLLRLCLTPILLSRSDGLDIYSTPEVPVLLTAKPSLE